MLKIKRRFWWWTTAITMLMRVNSNLHFVFAEKLYENSNKTNTEKNRPSFGKGKSKLLKSLSVHAFLIRTLIKRE